MYMYMYILLYLAFLVYVERFALTFALRILAHEEEFENAVDSPASMEGEGERPHPVIGTDSLDGFGITGGDSDGLVRVCVCMCVCVC